MKSGNKLFIFTGAALAVVAILLAITMSSGGNKADAQKEQDSSKVTVVKAAVDIEPHKVITSADIVTEEIDVKLAPSDFVADPSQILGQAYKLKAIKGDVLLAGFVEPPGIRNSIESGKRAVSLSVDAQGMMSGLIVDGDFVDIVFRARVDLRKVLQSSIGAEIDEDGPYSFKEIDADRSTEDTNQQYPGSPGSEFLVTDAGGPLEPVTKMMVQDVKVLRVIAPGVTYDAQGQQVAVPADGGPAVETTGQLIIEVTPQQAEAITFMQDQNHSFEVVVRGENDHEIATTTGITFQILMTDGTWSLPYPKSVFAEPTGTELDAPGNPQSAPEGTGPDE